MWLIDISGSGRPIHLVVGDGVGVLPDWAARWWGHKSGTYAATPVGSIFMIPGNR